MAKSNGGGREPWQGGNDAAGMKPKLIPDYELQGRDDSGGPDFEPYTASFGDGGFVQGEKSHLSVKGGKGDNMEGDELASMSARSKRGGNDSGGPAKSKSMQKE